MIVAALALALALALVAIVPAAAAAAAPTPWKTVTVTRRSGAVRAVMTIERRRSSYGIPDSRDLSLTVTVAGKTVFARKLCSPVRCGLATEQLLSLHNLWGDRLPEAVLDYYTGGAHCCFATLVVLPDGPHPGRLIAHSWGDPGYAIRTHGGTVDLVSADDRFAYAFTAFAASGLPVQVWTIDRAGAFADVTQTRLDLVRKDATQWWKAYTSERGKVDSDTRGVLAAWCADEYRLGDKAVCDAELASALAKGYLQGSNIWPENARFVALLHRELASWGYPSA